MAIFGNFVNRALVLTHKYYDGIIPTPSEFNETDIKVLDALRAFPAKLSDSLERYRFREASQELMNLARLGNKYLADEEPWKLIKTDTERTQTVMFVALQIATALGILSEPLLPFTAKKLKSILNIVSSNSEWEDISTKETLLAPGNRINKSELLFRKIEDKEIEAQLQKLEATKQRNQTSKMTLSPQKDTISYDDFAKLDLRVGTIVAAEKMPKADKLIKLKVNTGLDTRTIVSGIAQSFSPEEIIGKQVTVLVNLAPRKLRGVESQGMILMTENEKGKLVFVNPDEAEVSSGKSID